MPPQEQSANLEPAQGPSRCEVPAEPVAVVIFGASGDLTKRKLLPSLFDLATAGYMAERYAIVGVARRPGSDESFRKEAEEAVRSSKNGKAHPERAEKFIRSLRYVQADSAEPESIQKLAQSLGGFDRELNLGGNKLFYLSTPPAAFVPTIAQLGAAGLNRPERGWSRVIVEKPFGRDVESARKLNRELLSVFPEKSVYRIDHYLGKETVQNLLVFRFSNGIFEPLWNRNYIDHVQITVAEDLGVERRAAFYESAGAVRDMIQSHVLQLVSLVAMEPPAVFDATAVRNEKLKVLQSIHRFDESRLRADVVFGQYGPGQENGKGVPGYRQEPGVNADSSTETYAALKLEIENWRWAGVPFYLRTGKRMPRRATQIAIRFRRAPHVVFRGETVAQNWMVLDIQPKEGISLSFGAKQPGPQMEISPVVMDFNYADSFGPGSDNAYTTLLNDCMRGEATLFERSDNVEASWELVAPLLTAPRPSFPNYEAGSWGPAAADEMLQRDSREWRNP